MARFRSAAPLTGSDARSVPFVRVAHRAPLPTPARSARRGHGRIARVRDLARRAPSGVAARVRPRAARRGYTTRGRQARRSTASTTPTTARSPRTSSPTTRSTAWSSALDDRFSNYFSPDRVQALPGGPAQRVLRRRPGREPRTRAACASRGLRRLAGRARRDPQGRHRRPRRGPRPEGPRLRRVGRADQGPPGHAGQVTLRGAGGQVRTKTITRATVSVPVVASKMRAGRAARRSGSCASRSSARARTPRSTPRFEAPEAARREGVRARPARQRRRPRLRGAAHRQRVPARAARSSRRRGARSPTRTLNATGDPVAAKRRRRARRPGTRRRRRSSPARCRTASARRSSGRRRSARASSRRSSSSPTAARSTSPRASTSRRAAATSAARASRRAPASSRTCRRRTTPKTTPRRGRRARARASSPVPRVRAAAATAAGTADEAPEPPHDASRCSSKRGRFLIGEPFFERGRRVTIDRARATPAPGQLALLRTAARGRRPRQGRSASSGARTSPRDVIEALMLDRGLRRAFPPGRRARRARGAARRAGGADVAARRDLRDLSTFTIDPATAQDFDDAISAEALGDGRWRVWVHIADVSAFVRPGSPVDREAYRRATSVYVPGAVEPMLPEALSNDACSLRPGVDRLAVTVEMEIDGARSRAAPSTARSSAPTSAWTTTASTGSSPARRRAEAPWAEPLRRRAGRRGALQRRREARRRAGHRSSEPEFAFDPRGHVDEPGPQRADRVPPPHRAPDDRGQRAGRHAARASASIPALYRVHERPEPERGQAAGRAARLAGASRRRRCPSRSRPQQAADIVGRDLAPRRRSTSAAPATAARR